MAVDGFVPVLSWFMATWNRGYLFGQVLSAKALMLLDKTLLIPFRGTAREIDLSHLIYLAILF